MAERCRTCDHPDVREVDRLIVRGDPHRAIASRFGLNRGSVGRHAANHVSQALVAVQSRERASALLDRVEQLVDASERILRQAESEGRPQLALSAVRELRESLRLMGKLTGELDERPVSQTLVVNLHESPEFLAFKQRLLDAMAPYPEVRARVARALIEAGGDGG